MVTDNPDKAEKIEDSADPAGSGEPPMDTSEEKLETVVSNPGLSGSAENLSSWAPPTTPEQTPPTPQEEDKNSADEPDQAMSLQDRLAATAVSSTFGFLKLASDVTLSTTRPILAPSVAVTRDILLPQLFTVFGEIISSSTPQRIKDWFRILSSSLYHVVAVIKSTDRGVIFRGKVLQVGGDLLEVSSSESSRQALMDAMASVVKLSEALHTPEAKALLDQLAVMGCRAVDLASMDKNKQLIHDFYGLLWSGFELLADPATTTAFAEVAAYLCHALEMEHSEIHSMAHSKEKSKAAAQRRYQRNRQQKKTYKDPFLIGDPNATVEEVILSALGAVRNENEEEPTMNSLDEGLRKELRKKKSAKSPKKKSSNEENQEGSGIAEEARYDIDVDILRERIVERASALERFSPPVGQQLVGVGDRSSSKQEEKEIEDLQEITNMTGRKTETSFDKSKNRKLEWDSTEESEVKLADGKEPSGDIPNVAVKGSLLPLEGEAPVDHFYRVLDEVLKEKRKEALDKVLSSSRAMNFEEDAPQASTLKKQLKAIRSKALKGNPGQKNSMSMLVKIALLVGAFIAVLWFAFGCFGVYMYWSTKVSPSHVVRSPVGSNRDNEIVIRVVREVRHYNGDDTLIGQELPAVSEADRKAVTECIAAKLTEEL